MAPLNFNELVRHYADIINPLFWHDSFYQSDSLFEYVCTLLRAGGVQSEGWDAYLESKATLRDLKVLGEIELPGTLFPDVKRTRARLALIAYCHATEMDWPYFLIANLLRVRLGQKYDIRPFRILNRVPKKKRRNSITVKPPSPLQKIGYLKQLAEDANLPGLGNALAAVCDNIIRNAVYHSDYVLHSNELRLLRGSRLSTRNNHLTQVVAFDELADLVNGAFAFYSALLQLYERALTLLKDFEFAFLPFDSHYKGLLELVFDDGVLVGFRAYWPNGTLSEYKRQIAGCTATNIVFNPDGSMNFFVGLHAAQPSSFSPLVEHDAKPVYAARPGTDVRPYWPVEIRAYKLSDLGNVISDEKETEAR